MKNHCNNRGQAHNSLKDVQPTVISSVIAEISLEEEIISRKKELIHLEITAALMDV